jgi:hypothetical protein
MRKQILIYISLLSAISASTFAQVDSFNIDSFQRYTQINMGLSYGHFLGEVSNFTKAGGSFDMQFAEGWDNHIFGFNINALLSNKVKEFTIPAGYEHYDSPATFFLGVFYGSVLGNQHKSHFHWSVGFSYALLFHRKRDQKTGSHHGFVPRLEIGRSIKIGKSKLSYFQYTSQYTPMKYDPSISQRFIDIFVGYQHLLLNSAEAKGGLLVAGLRYKFNKYSTNKNLNK